MSQLRVLYMPRMHQMNGRQAIAGRLLLAHLRTEQFEVVVRHSVVSDDHWEQADDQLRADLMSESSLFDFAPQCIISEDGLAAGPDTLRVPVGLMDDYLRSGGVLITDGFGRNYSESLQRQGHEAATRDEARLLDLTLWREWVGSQPSSAYPYIYDFGEQSPAEHTVGCRPDRIAVSPWLQPTFKGIERVLVASACPLQVPFGASILLATEDTASLLAMDMFVNAKPPFFLGQVRPVGWGFAAAVSGSVFHDYYVDQNPDNAIWVSNLALHLADEAERERSLRALPEPRRPRPVGQRDTTELLAAGEGSKVEFKETFLVDVKNGRVEKFLIHEVLKTVAAFLNTDGGTLLIGVDDNGEPVGLSRDIESLNGKKSEDAFVLRLTSSLKQSLGIAAAQMAHTYVERVGDATICRVEVSRSREPVYLTADKGKDGRGNMQKDEQALYIRVNNESVILSNPRDIATWIKNRA